MDWCFDTLICPCHPATLHCASTITLYFAQAILVSAPSMASIGADSVGLHLYTSNASHLETWQQYIPRPLPSNGDPCVICPSIVPDWTYASNIGDTYVWSSPPANEAVQPGSNRTIYVLSGSSACGPNDNGGHWCGYGKGTPQMLLFSSTNLVDWKFVNVFWKGGSTADPNGQSPGSGSMYTPDTFRLADGRQALIRLAGKTVYNLGQFNEQKGTFLDLDDGALHTESNGAFHCGQSMTDAKGRRVQFGWLGLHLQGAPYSGAQSLPRLITAAPPDLNLGPDKLLFAPLPELAVRMLAPLFFLGFFSSFFRFFTFIFGQFFYDHLFPFPFIYRFVQICVTPCNIKVSA